MRAPDSLLVLRVLCGLCAGAGFIAWIGVAWKIVTDLDSVTPQSEEGGSTLTWALSSTLLLIFGMIIFHLVAHTAEEEESEESGSR